MTRTLSKLVLGTSLAILVNPPDIFAGRGGGYRGGGRGGYSGGNRGGGMGGSPSFSQPRSPTSQSGAHPQNGNTSGAAAARAMPTATRARPTLQVPRPQARDMPTTRLGSPRRCPRRRSGLCQQPGFGSPGSRWCRRRRGLCQQSGFGSPGSRWCRRRRGLCQPQPGRGLSLRRCRRRRRGLCEPVPSRHGQRLLERKRLRRLWHDRLRHGGRGMGKRLADVWLGLFGL